MLTRRPFLFAAPSVLAPAETASGGPVRAPITRPLVDFGVKADGSDQQISLEAAFKTAFADGVGISVPPGVYGHSGILHFSGPMLVGEGHGSELRALDPENSCLYVEGDSIRLAHLMISSPHSVRRGGKYDCNAVVFRNSRNFECHSITIEGGMAAGLLFDNCHDGVVHSPRSIRTLADALHFTNGSSKISVFDPVSQDCGDDSVAIVSYQAQRAVCRDIQVFGGRSIGSNARGFTVVGGERIRFWGPYVQGCQAAGIYIASEAAFSTFGCRDVLVVGATVLDSVQSPRIRQSALYAIGRDGTSPTTDGDFTLGVENCGFVDCSVRGNGAGMRSAIALLSGTRRAFARNCNVYDVRAYPRGPPPNMIDLAGEDSLISGNFGSGIGGALISMEEAASGVIQDLDNGGEKLSLDVSVPSARIYRLGNRLKMVRVEGGTQFSENIPAKRAFLATGDARRMNIFRLMHNNELVSSR